MADLAAAGRRVRAACVSAAFVFSFAASHTGLLTRLRQVRDGEHAISGPLETVLCPADGILQFLFNSLVTPPSFLRLAPVADPVTEDVEERSIFLAENVLDETAALPADLGQSGFDALPPAAEAPAPTR